MSSDVFDIFESISDVFLKENSLQMYDRFKKDWYFELEIYFMVTGSNQTYSFSLTKESNRNWHAIGVRHHLTFEVRFYDICYDRSHYCNKLTEHEYDLKTFL